MNFEISIKANNILSKVKEGDTVKVHYTGKLTDDGTVFDSSRDRDPLEFTLGQGQLIPGFEEAVIGMEEGDSTTVDIASEDAYGERRDDLELEVSKSDLPDNIDPQVGMQLQMQQQENGQAIPVQITAVEDETVKLDANHPLAGKDLTFDIELVELQD
jgi:peptidylprolyl isomerase